MVRVFQFKTLDQVTRQMVTQPVKSTAERIGRIPFAEIIERSGEDVPAEMVDADGRARFHS